MEKVLNDLCARLPYGVKVNVTDSTIYKDPMTVMGIDYSKEVVKVGENVGGMFFTHNEKVTDVKPYLRPMSSMTDIEQKKYRMYICEIESSGFNISKMSEMIGWLNSIYVDYNGLIPMGLALEAPDGMYNF